MQKTKRNWFFDGKSNYVFLERIRGKLSRKYFFKVFRKVILFSMLIMFKNDYFLKFEGKVMKGLKIYQIRENLKSFFSF